MRIAKFEFRNGGIKILSNLAPEFLSSLVPSAYCLVPSIERFNLSVVVKLVLSELQWDTHGE